MKRTILPISGAAVLVFLLLAIGHKAPAEQCDIEVGNSVRFTTADKVYTRLSAVSLDLKKGEFETTDEYTKRIAKYSDRDKSPILVEVTDDHLMQYDADTETFYFSLSSLNQGLEGEMFASFEDNHARDYFNGMITERPDHHYSSLRNSSLRLQQQNSEEWGVYDLQKGEREMVQGKLRSGHWYADTIADFTLSIMEHKSAAVTFKMPRKEARTFKTNARVGVSMIPRIPFFTSGDPESTRIIFADVLCAVITDGNGTIVKTILPAS